MKLFFLCLENQFILNILPNVYAIETFYLVYLTHWVLLPNSLGFDTNFPLWIFQIPLQDKRCINLMIYHKYNLQLHWAWTWESLFRDTYLDHLYDQSVCITCVTRTDYISQRWAQYLPFYMFLNSVTLPLSHQEVESKSPCLEIGLGLGHFCNH